MEPLFIISGIVTPSSQRGRTLGYPTANLNIETKDLVEGIYVAYTFYDQQKLPSLLFIGSALTFGDSQRKVEVYVLAKVDNWYGEKITVEPLKKIRDNKKFDSTDQLIVQIKIDEVEAHKFFDCLSE